MTRKNEEPTKLHTPVLLSEVLDVLRPKAGESYLDLTAGYGGHAEAVLELTKAPYQTTLVDRDVEAIDALTKKFGQSGVEVIKDDFYTSSENLLEANKQFDMILADLGVSSVHLNTKSRGFSIQLDGPLDMRMDQHQALTADTIVNTYKPEQLAKLIKVYGDEPKASRIAGLIVRSRPIKSTGELASIVSRAWHGYSRTHPAIRTFQALRIAVNDEIGLLERSIPLWLELLAPNGRLAVISFHSLEDRIVKRFIQDHSGNRYDADLILLTKRPITAGSNEIVSNPRARSAKLRAAAKINNKRKGDANANSGKKQLPNLQG